MVGSRLKKIVFACDVVHLHGLWTLYGLAALQTAQEQGKVSLVAAHGMLDQWALANRRWKKSIYSLLVERRNLQRATCLHALTAAEAQDYRRYGLEAPIAIIPNGVQVPDTIDTEMFHEAFPYLRGHEIVLYLGRLHHKKGLDLLCRAWVTVHDGFPNAHLVIAGPDSENTRARIENLVNESGLRASVTFAGMLSGLAKWAALAAATVFVLPSYSEGFSVAVLEALAIGLPVVISRQCNFPEVEQYRCGWVTEAEAGPVGIALSESLSLSEDGRRELSKNALNLIARRYAWSVIGGQMAGVYDWLRGAPKPSNVDIQ
jgi:glycosyltransferase involved in cell wall biosynthesis